MRKLLFSAALIFGAGVFAVSGADQAQAVSGTNFSKAPGAVLDGSLAEPVAYFLHRKWYKGCYRPYWCKYKYGYKYKGCWYGSCYHKKHYGMYKKYHHYKHHHHHHHFKKH
ncbi:MAG: hypothetical protein Kow0032_14980 [Methyloligellaceae bacterium]